MTKHGGPTRVDHTMKPLTADDLNGMACHCGGKNCSLFLHPKCHVGAGLDVRWWPETQTLQATCKRCHKLAGEFLVEQEPGELAYVEEATYLALPAVGRAKEDDPGNKPVGTWWRHDDAGVPLLIFVKSHEPVTLEVYEVTHRQVHPWVGQLS